VRFWGARERRSLALLKSWFEYFLEQRKLKAADARLAAKEKVESERKATETLAQDESVLTYTRCN